MSVIDDAPFGGQFPSPREGYQDSNGHLANSLKESASMINFTLNGKEVSVRRARHNALCGLLRR